MKLFVCLPSHLNLTNDEVSLCVTDGRPNPDFLDIFPIQTIINIPLGTLLIITTDKTDKDDIDPPPPLKCPEEGDNNKMAGHTLLKLPILLLFLDVAAQDIVMEGSNVPCGDGCHTLCQSHIVKTLNKWCYKSTKSVSVLLPFLPAESRRIRLTEPNLFYVSTSCLKL